MLALIPLPYRLLGAMILALALFAGGFGYGVKVTKDHAAVKQLAAERLAAEQYRAEVDRGNALSAKLSVAESAIQTKTIERIIHVKDVTTGGPCLSADAVSLLNGTDKPTLRETSGQPVAESPAEPALASGNTASDKDISEWILIAQNWYETCAARQSMLVDFVEGNK